jgi:hypothetical protein
LTQFKCSVKNLRKIKRRTMRFQCYFGFLDMTKITRIRKVPSISLSVRDKLVDYLTQEALIGKRK